MLARIIIVIIVSSSIIYACNEKEVSETGELIKINPHDAKDEINLSEIADSVKCIKLQTDSNCLMGRVRKIIIKEKYIYAIDASQKIIFIFDKNGRFVSKLDKRGKGPGEYMQMGPIFIDDNEEFIEFMDLGSKKNDLLKYSNISFNLVDKLPMPGISFNMCTREGGTRA